MRQHNVGWRLRGTSSPALGLWCLLLGLVPFGGMLQQPDSLWAAPADDDYTLGITLYGQKRWELAAETLAEYLKKHPEHAQVPLAKLYLAQSYVHLQKYQEAREQLREFLKRFPENKNRPQALYRVAECSYFLDDFPAAIEEFLTFLKQAPEDALTEWAYPYLADAYLRNNQPQQAEEVFLQSLEKFPEGRFVEDSRFGLARARELRNQAREAIAVYRELISQPQSRRAPEALVNLGMLYFQLSEYQEAAETFRSLLERFPESSLVPLAELNTGYAHYSLKEWEQAEQYFQRAEQSDAYRDLARFWRAQALKGRNQWSQAEQLLSDMQQQELSEDLAPRVAYQLADVKFQQGAYARAREDYVAYLDTWAQASQRETVWLRAIECDLLLTQVAEGWQRASEKPPFTLSPAGERELALLQSRLLTLPEEKTTSLPDNWKDRPARLQQAEQLLQPQLEETVQELETPLAQQIRFQLARILKEQDKTEEMVQQLRPITTELPEEARQTLPEAWLLLASGLLELEEPAEALAVLERPTPEQWAQRIVERDLLRLKAMLALGQLNEAEQVLTELDQQKLDSARWVPAAYQLADACYAREEWARAERLYQSLLQREPAAEWKLRGLSGLGWSQYEAGEFEESAQTFRRLQQEFPESAQSAADAGYMRAMAELKGGRQAEAARQFLETAEKFQSPEDISQGDAVHYIAYRAAREAARTFRQLEEIESAAEAYQLAYRELAKQPEDRQQSLDKLLDEWALLHYEHEQFDEADEVFRLLIKLRPESDRADDARLSLAESAYISGKLTEARQMLEELLELPQADDYVKRRARYNLVLIASEQTDLPAVQQFARSYLEALDPQQVPLEERGEVESQLIQFYLETEALDQAEQELASLRKRLEAITPQERPAWGPGVLVQAAELARRRKQYDQARSLLEQLRQEHPDTPEVDQAEVIAGRTYIAEANFAQAQQAFQAVLNRAEGKKSLSAAQSQFYLAETSLMKKDYETALKDYIRMAVLFPGYPELQTAALFQAGQCDEALGNIQQAIQSYENLRQQFPDSEFAPKAQTRIEQLRNR